MTETNITMVVAMDFDRGIGMNGRLPWHLGKDMEHFKKVTMGKVVVMGRKTYESLNPRWKPLPKRENIVLSRNFTYDPPGCAVIHDADAVIRMSKYREVCVIGGGEIYRCFLPVATKLLVTHVDTLISDADTLFPEINREWRGKKLFQHFADEKNGYDFSVYEYTRDKEI